jgi:hypothetical protein
MKCPRRASHFTLKSECPNSREGPAGHCLRRAAHVAKAALKSTPPTKSLGRYTTDCNTTHSTSAPSFLVVQGKSARPAAFPLLRASPHNIHTACALQAPCSGKDPHSPWAWSDQVGHAWSSWCKGITSCQNTTLCFGKGGTCCMNCKFLTCD